MKIKCYVYERNNTPLFSLTKLPNTLIYGKHKFVGRFAKMEAIERFCGEVIPFNYSTDQINKYIDSNIFGTNKWKEYHAIFQDVCAEKSAHLENYIFLHSLVVEIDDNKTTGGEVVADTLLFCIASKVLGDSTYKNIADDVIISIDREEGEE